MVLSQQQKQQIARKAANAWKDFFSRIRANHSLGAIKGAFILLRHDFREAKKIE